MNPLADALRTERIIDAFRLTIPEIALVGFACILLLFGLYLRNRWVHWSIAMFGLLSTAALAIFTHDTDTVNWYVSTEAAAGMAILPGPIATFIRWLVIGVGLVYLVLCTKELRTSESAEYLSCLFVVLCGTSLVSRANDLVSLYLALEMISIPTYVLLFLPGQAKAALESMTKYFLLSVLSSAIMLFGFSYLFGALGSTNLSAIQATIRHSTSFVEIPMVSLAMVMVVVGIGYRITAVPFHYYAPDVYQGGPTGVIAMLAVIPKIAGFVALARLLGFSTLPITEIAFTTDSRLPLMFFVLALVTMTLGNIMALLQDNLKRLLAYSGIAHSGYLLMGLVTTLAYASAETRSLNYVNGWDATLFYLVAYSFMTIGFLAIISHLQSAETPIESADDLAGIGQTNPMSAAMLTIALLSLIGFPLTAGFSGKLLLFMGTYSASQGVADGNHYRILTIIAAVNAAIGAVYYLRLIGIMYLRSPLRPAEPARCSGPFVAAIICTIGTLAVGIYPGGLSEWTRAAAPIKVFKVPAATR